MWDVDPLPLRLLGPAAARARGGARVSRRRALAALAGAASRSALGVAARCRAGAAAATAPAGGRRSTRSSARSATARRATARASRRRPLAAAAARLHRRQVQDPARRRAARCPPTTTCAQIIRDGHAVHLDAGLAAICRDAEIDELVGGGQVLLARTSPNPDEAAGSRSRFPKAPDVLGGVRREGQGGLRAASAARACHGELGRGDGTSAPTLTDDWGNPIRARRPDQALDLPRRPDARGHLPHLHHRHERHADAVVRRVAAATRSAGSWSTTSPVPGRAATSPGYSNLMQVQWSDGRARSRPQGQRAVRRGAGGAVPDRRPDHRAGPRLPSRRRRRSTVRAVYNAKEIAFLRDLARHARRHHGPQRARPAGAEDAPPAAGRSRARRPAAAASRRASAERRRLLGRGGGAAPRPRPAGGDFWGEEGGAAAAPRRRRRVLGRRGDPAAGRSCRAASASRTSSSATRRTRSTCGSSIWREATRAALPRAPAARA